MNIQQLLLILRAQAKVILYTLLICVLITLVVNLILPKQYMASAAVVIDVKSPDPIAGMVLPGMISPSYMATQVDIINSDRVAQRVVKLLRLDENQAIRDQWQEATGGKGQLFIWLAKLLQQNLDVKPSIQSNLININYSGIDPAFSAAVANAFAQAYIDINLELKVEPARQSTVWFDGQTKILRDRLETTQTALSGYQQKTGIVATDERLDFETTKLNELSTQLTVVQAQTSDSRSKSKSAGASDTLPDVMQNPLILGLKADIARLEARQQDNNINLGTNHPQSQRAASELASLKAKLNIEMRQISHSLDTSTQVGRQKEKELIAALESQKVRVLDLNRQRDEISVLKRDVEAAQRAFELVGQRSAITRLESLSIQTNVVMLSPATEPAEFSRPRIFLNLLISLLFGTVLGIALALIRELSSRRIRSSVDLAEASGLSILASIPSTRPKASTRRFLMRRNTPTTRFLPAT
jgi:chain length determinant protein EpsF